MRKILICSFAAALIISVIGYLVVSRSRIHHDLEQLSEDMAQEREQSNRFREDLSSEQKRESSNPAIDQQQQASQSADSEETAAQ